MTTHYTQGDTAPPLAVALRRADGTAVDLTDAVEIELVVKMGPDTLVVAMAVVGDAANGAVEHVWVAGETDTVGTHRFAVRVTWNDDGVQTFPSSGYGTLKIQAAIEPPLPGLGD